jgi:putative oxidoreductase
MNDSSRYISLFARILLSIVFLLSGVMKFAMFSQMVPLMQTKGFPLPPVSLGIAAAVEVIGALLLITGYRARVGAWVLFVYLIPATLVFHNFWAFQGMEQQAQMVNFLKNLAIMGGLLMIAAFGPGKLSIGNRAAESH